MQELESIRGVVQAVTFHNAENGFCVLQITVRGRRDRFTVVGYAPGISEGEVVECEGRWLNNARFGLQFKAEKMSLSLPGTADGMQKYLASGMIKGIGSHYADLLVQAFGSDVFDVVEAEPRRLLTVPGIGEKRLQNIIDGWNETRAVREIMVFLHSHNVGTARAVKIYRMYGEKAIDMVREDPYRLARDIDGIGFKTADAIGRSLGLEMDSPARIKAGIAHILYESSTQGHCALEFSDLLSKVASLLEVAIDKVETEVAMELSAENLYLETIDGKSCVFLPPFYFAEKGVANGIMRLLQTPCPWGRIDLDAAIPAAEKQSGLQLSPSQKEAVKLCLGSKVSIITGGPGVGKTTIVKTILSVLQSLDLEVVLSAPTGRAAKRLAESTLMEARTIHRTLEFDPSIMGFRRNEHEPLEADFIVVDEVSMVDILLMNKFLKAVPEHAALLLVGDIDQLPSVGPGAVFSDIIESGIVPVARLTEIFRQVASSRIIVNAHRINKGQAPLKSSGSELTDFYFIEESDPEKIAEKVENLVTERIPRRFGFNPLRDIQVLTPMNRGRLGTASMNAGLQKLLNPGFGYIVKSMGLEIAVGDKVIQTVNNYDKEVFNGDIGFVVHVNQEDKTLQIEFDGRPVDYDYGELDEISLAYAITIHKSQGSEYPAVVIPLNMEHYPMLERNLLYTAVTRGRELVVIVGGSKAMSIAIRNVRSVRRMTNLKYRLQDSALLEKSDE
jgi:exodeoxyribonuclease V alpha subunit